ncbi:MAG: 5'-3' exonuclease [Buchnera aphidicola (Pentalonia nigronervosa)]|uniref:5'-3' exonuclease n=1 Tax=Buchnera aphidicola (Pentalonia nigronervosa) TaxID=1309793 RepID=A0A7H1AYS2_9GAMM|nr:MAG: 5'-3' exonuclease [Buchnera aphidicola (Pentalonia nigronervosa)]
MIHIKKNPIIIIDGNLYLYRYYYVFPNFKNASGTPSGAIYGMIKMIYSLLNKYKDSKKFIIIFDSSKNTFRKKIFKEYKNHRKPMPNTLYVQIAPLLTILKNSGIKTLTIKNVEADDIIGSLSYKFEKEGEEILIVSDDKDMLQLITENIYVLNKSNNIITLQTIQKKYGIRPKSLIDLLALTGDVSDNIPGIPKIGIKTALYLLQTFSNIKNIYYNIKKIPNLSFRNAKNIAIQLKNYKKTAFISYELAKIKLDVPIQITLEEINLKLHSSKKLLDSFKEYDSQK